jgi:hypothetical protein
VQAVRCSEPELSSDNTLFHLLSVSTSAQSDTENLQTSFTSVLSQLSGKSHEVIVNYNILRLNL